MTGDPDLDIGGGTLSVESEGTGPKFVDKVEQITFSSEYAVEIDQPVMYITERAVFKFTEDGLVLTEIAPGIDIDADIFDQIEFGPIIGDDLTKMDSRLFREDPMDLTEFVN